MKLLKEAHVRAFVHATESEEKVKGILLQLLPKGAKIESTRLKGHFGNPIVCLDAHLSETDALEFWKKILSSLSLDSDGLLRTLEGRVEESCLYLRLDKQLAAEGKFSLTDSGDAIHIKLRLGGPPSSTDERSDPYLRAEKEIRSGTI